MQRKNVLGMVKHYLNYLTDVMSHQWNDPALTDFGENHEYTFAELRGVTALTGQLPILLSPPMKAWLSAYYRISRRMT